MSPTLTPLPPITPEEFQVLNDYITERFGMHFAEHKQEILVSRLARRLQHLNLKSFMDYYLLLQYNTNGEIAHLTNTITNNETYFFRETHQFDALFDHALPELKEGLSSPGTLRVLCAGCSSGEEPYTFNLYAKQNQYRMWEIQAAIDAFDLEPERVTMALAAQYGPSSMRFTTEEQLQKYFTVMGKDRFSLKNPFRVGVRFFQGNIMEPASFVKPIPYDVLFCRNVLIYFSEPALHKAIAHFARALRPGGLLFLGHSESIIGVSPLFQAIRLGDCIAYRKVAG